MRDYVSPSEDSSSYNSLHYNRQAGFRKRALKKHSGHFNATTCNYEEKLTEVLGIFEDGRL